MIRVLCVCGARPNFVKIAPIMEALSHQTGTQTLLVHTGQHYDTRMSGSFFEQLHIPEPDVNLEVGSASHGAQTAEVMKRFEPVCVEWQPDWVVVVGDVNSTVACALVAAKLPVKLAHVEAGLRSFDRNMPEEVNRIVTDSISDHLFVSEQSGLDNLEREGVPGDMTHFVGNVMVDTLLKHRAQAETSSILTRLGLQRRGYALLTMHRPSNVECKEAVTSILDALEVIGSDMPVVFPIHPRTRQFVHELGLSKRVERIKNMILLDPLGYLDFLKLMDNAGVVLTDSGGIQEETTVLGVPCLTLRDNTERPITISSGTNRLVGRDTHRIISAYNESRTDPPRLGVVPELWDGKSGERIVQCLLSAEQPALSYA